TEQRKGIQLLEEILVDNCDGKLRKGPKSKLLNNLGSAYVQMGDYEKGEAYLMKAIRLKREINNLNSLAYTLNELASMHNHMQEYTTALTYAEEAQANAQADIYLTHDILRNLTHANTQLGRFEQGITYSNALFELKDSIFDLEKEGALAAMATQFELANQQRDIAKKDLKIAQQKHRLNQIIIGMLLAFLVFSALYLWLRQQWHKQKLEAQKLQELDQLKSTFFTNISHEFRTPLTLISSILEHKPQRQPHEDITLTAKEGKIVQRNADRLLELIDQLLDLAKLEAGKMRLALCESDLSQFLNQLLQSFESLAKQRNIQLQFISRQQPLLSLFDPDKVEKIIINLLSNAFKFTPNDGKIVVLLQEKNGQAEIVVQDNGIGIPSEHMTHIFDRFHQVDASSTKAFEGSGIGLALVQQMVKAHHGQIRAESQAQQGTAFIVQLPLDPAVYQNDDRLLQQPAAPKRPKIPASLRPQPPTKSVETPSPDQASQPLIHLIEDNPDLRFILRQLLANDYQIIESANGQEGLEQAMAHIPDLILCDIMMPEMDGHAVCQALKKDHRTSHIPIILLSAKATQKEKIEGLELGADDYLVKPFDQNELLVRIQNLIQQRNELQRRFAQKVIYRTKDEKVLSKEDAFIKELLEIIDREVANEQFGVEELSQAVHMSRSQLYRKVKALTGKTPNSFLRNIRLERAHQLLSQNA
ncbi:MAG: response regulator, partial [Bacteroidota bacterium]